MPHPNDILERMELILLRAIYLEAKLKPLNKNNPAIKGLLGENPGDTVSFEFKLINEKESNLSFEKQRSLLRNMDANGTIWLSYDEETARDWDILTKYYISVDLAVLENHYSLLSSKHPESKAFLWYRAPDSDDLVFSNEEKPGFSLEGTYEFGPLKASDGILFCNDAVWPLVDRLKFILIYLMKNPGFRSYRGIFIDMYPNRRQAKRSIINISSYVSALSIQVQNKTYGQIDIIRDKRFDPNNPNDGPLSGCELILKKPRKARKPPNKK